METKPKLLRPDELDALLRYPAGRSAKLARAGKFPHITLPDGALRFSADAIDQILKAGATGMEVDDAQ